MLRVTLTRNGHSIAVLCDLFLVSPSGFYDWDRRRTMPGPRATEDQVVAERIAAIHAASRQTYGVPRIALELRGLGRRHGRNRIARLMRNRGLCGRQKGRHRVRTTDSNHDHPIAPNRLAEAPATTAPNQIWVADITYAPTAEG